MSSYNIYGSGSSPSNGSVGVSNRSSLTSDRESYSSRIRSREIDNGTFEDSPSRISSLRTSPRYRRTTEENSDSKKMQNLHTEEAGGTEVPCASPSQRLKERKGASSARSGKFANRKMREKRRGTGKVVVEDDDFMDELAKENAVKNTMISSTGNEHEEETSPVIPRDLQQKDDDENDDSTQSRVEKRRAARQRRQMQDEATGNGVCSSSISNNDRPSRERHSGEVATLKEDLTRERDEKGALLKAMTSLTR